MFSYILKYMFYGAYIGLIFYESEEEKLIKQLKKLSPKQMDKLISDCYEWIEVKNEKFYN